MANVFFSRKYKAVRLPLKNLLYCFVREPALFQHSRFFSVYHCIISARRIQAFIGFARRSPIHGDFDLPVGATGIFKYPWQGLKNVKTLMWVRK